VCMFMKIVFFCNNTIAQYTSKEHNTPNAIYCASVGDQMLALVNFFFNDQVLNYSKSRIKYTPCAMHYHIHVDTC